MQKICVVFALALIPAPTVSAQAESEYWLSAGSANAVFVVDERSIVDKPPHIKEAWVYLLNKKITVMDGLPVAVVGTHYVVDCQSFMVKIDNVEEFDDQFATLRGAAVVNSMRLAPPSTPIDLSVRMICRFPTRPIEPQRIITGPMTAVAAGVRMTCKPPNQ